MTDSFTDYFFDATGLVFGDGITQNDFSVNYTAWLTTILNDDAADWLESQNLDIVGGFSVKLNQNDPEGAPYIQYYDSNNVLQTFALDELFESVKLDFDAKTGKVTQTRYYFDTFAVPGAENQAPTDIHLTIDGGFAAAVEGGGGGFKDAVNNTTGDAILIGFLSATDPDLGDTHSFEIVNDPTGSFVLDGNKLMLDTGDSIDQVAAVSSFTVTIKVTDSGDPALSYYETFTFTAGTKDADSVAGTETSGDGTTEVTAVLGDDVELGFFQNDPLNGTSGDDALFGGQGADTLNGGDGDDQLFGGFNDDTLIGGTGDDVLQGDHGADTFVFKLSVDDGDDTIDDFARTEDILKFTDVVDVGAAGLTFEDVDAAVSSFDNGGAGGDLTVNFNNGASITLIGVGTAGVIDSVADLVDNAAAQIVVT
jgi:hypothetical protein